jgi:hypothetical protein
MTIIKIKYLEKPDINLVLQNIIKAYGYKGGITILYKNEDEILSTVENLEGNEVLRSLNIAIYHALYTNLDIEIEELND